MSSNHYAANPVTIIANGQHNGFPGLTCLADGTLVAAWKDSPQHGVSAFGVLAQSISTDGGRTWSAKETIYPVADGLECGDVGLVTRQNGPNAGQSVAAFFRRGGGVVSGWTLQTNDPTAGWDTLTNITDSLFPTWGVASNAPVEKADGSLLVAVYGFETEVSYPTGYTTTGQNTYVLSTGSNNVTFANPVLVGDGVTDSNNYQEPELCVLDNGDIICVMRSDTTRTFYLSRSTDGGATWTAPTPMPLGALSGRPMLCQMSSGRLILVARVHRNGIMGYTVSTDRGVTWSRFGIIDRTDGLGTTTGPSGFFAYGQMCEVEPNVVGIVYSLENGAGTPHQIANRADLFFTYLTLDDVARLT